MIGPNTLKFTLQINVFNKFYINKEFKNIPDFQFNDKVEVGTSIFNDHFE